MGVFADTHGNKNPGELILASHWNALVAAIETVTDGLSSQISALDAELRAQIETMQTDVTGLKNTVEALEKTAAHVRAQHRVTASTTRVNYILGEITTLRAVVTDFEGSPLNLSNAATRPWVDFVADWGVVRVAPGFSGTTGQHGRSAAVQVNAQGIAEVTLRADQIEGISDDDELSVASALEAVVPAANKSVAQIMLESKTPVEAKTRGAFSLLTTEYDRDSAPAFQRYTDGYFKTRPERFVPPLTGFWRDHHATVLVMSRNDNDATTPDHARGAASIQVTFRDWVSHWLDLDYFIEAPDLVDRYAGRLKNKVIPQKYGDSLNGLYEEVQAIVKGGGVLGQMRDYRAAHSALSQIDLDAPVAFLPDLIKDTQGFVRVQQSLVLTQAVTPGIDSGEPVLSGFASAFVQSESNLGDVRGEIAAVGAQVNGARAAAEEVVSQAETRVGAIVANAEKKIGEQVAGLDQRLGGLNGNFDKLQLSFTGLNQRFDSELPAVGQQFAELKMQVGKVEENFTSAIGNQLNSLQQQVGQLQGRVGTVEGRFSVVDSAVLGDGGRLQSLESSLDTLRSQIGSFENEGVAPQKIAVGLNKVETFDAQFAVFSKRLSALEGG